MIVLFDEGERDDNFGSYKYVIENSIQRPTSLGRTKLLNVSWRIPRSLRLTLMSAPPPGCAGVQHLTENLKTDY